MQRRAFLVSTGALLTSTLITPPKLWGINPPKVGRKLHLYNIHTGEFFHQEFGDGNHIFPEAQKELEHFLRDWRTGDVHAMDPELINLVHALQKKMECLHAFDVISGYRSPKTNAALRLKSHGVAQNSKHISGQAIDISSRNRLHNLRDLAKSYKKGGVGYYPKQGFVHVDIRSKPTSWGGGA